MGIPEQVLKQEEEIDKMLAGTPEDEGLVENEDAVEKSDDQEVAPVESALVEEKKDDTKDREYWEQRFKVVDGKLKAEIPRLSDTIRQLEAQNKELQAALEELKTKQPETQNRSYLSDDELEKFEEEGFDRDTIGMIEAMAERIAESRIAEFNKKMDKLSNDVAISANDRFFLSLSDKVPDWEALNVDQGFLNWLAESDGYSGLTRQQSLDNAYGVRDVARVSRIFNDYKQSIGVPVKANDKLRKQIAPDRSKSSPPPVDGKKVWTAGEIRKFYLDQATGRYDGKDVSKTEKDIFLAEKEGRIVP